MRKIRQMLLTFRHPSYPSHPSHPSALRGFEPRVLCPERLLPYGSEADDQLGVVVQHFDAEHRADAELRMAHLHPELHGHAGGLIFVLVGVRRRRLARAIAATAAAVRVGTKRP